jgi:hypothetical protein
MLIRRHPLVPALALPLLVAALASAATASRARAQEQEPSSERMPPPYPTRCGTTIPENETRGYVPLPRGDVFCPLVADPKGIRSFVSYLRETSEQAETDVGSVGIGDTFGLLRWSGPRPGDGLQLSLEGSVFAQFDLDTRSYDLLNADFLIGLPLTWRRGGSSARARVYHQSSHLGDEFLLRGEHPERENLSFEAVELILSQDAGAFRAYAGGEVLVHRSPRDLDATVAHGGVELRPHGTLTIGRLASARLLAAVDVKAAREQDWSPAWSLRAGFDFGRPRESRAAGGRWSLLAEYYSGPSPYGQFYRTDVTLVGVGLHFLTR